VHASIVDKHKTINKPVRRTALWSAVLISEEDNKWRQDQMAVAQDSPGTTRALKSQSQNVAPQRKQEHPSAAHKAGV
jgi:hypothetical protein